MSTEPPALPRRTHNRVPFMLVAAAISAIPFWGHFVHGGRDQQWYFLVILVAWFVAGVAAIASVVVTFVKPASTRAIQTFSIVVTILLLLTAIAGFWGVKAAFFELVAG